MADHINNSGAQIEPSEPDPVRRTQAQMKQSLPRRFYQDVAAVETADGFVVQLDGKPVRTPGKAVLVLPSSNAAELIVTEFSEQKEVIDPTSMPVLRIVNSAIDGVASDLDAVLDDIISFSGSDLVCYRAGTPQALVIRQSDAWDPVLDWARSELKAHFILTQGVMHVTQPQVSLDAVRLWLLQRREPLLLASIHVMTTLSGSALLALCVDSGALPSDKAWSAAHIDEDWNAQQWGEDEEATIRRHARQRDFNAAAALGQALRSR